MCPRIRPAARFHIVHSLSLPTTAPDTYFVFVSHTAVIPIAPATCRFSAEGYRLPKPLINIVGRPMLFWLLDNLKFEAKETLWVGVHQELEAEYAIEARLRKEYPSLDLRVVLIDFQTRGAAETLFIMLQVDLHPSAFSCSERAFGQCQICPA